MQKLIDNITRIKDRINHLDSPYSVWLTSRPSIINPKRIGFSKRLRLLTGVDGYNMTQELKDVVKMWNRGVYVEKTDEWYREMAKNGKARIRRGLSRDEAEKLCQQIADIGGKAIMQQDKDSTTVTSERRALEADLREAEAALKAERQRVQTAIDEADKKPDYSALLSEETLEIISAFAKEHGVEYFITEKGLVDIFGDVEIGADDLTDDEELPFAFGRIYGDFICQDIGLTSLEGCPHRVDGDFDCSWNHLSSLAGCPRYVGGDFTCVENEAPDDDFDYDEEDLPDFIGGECTIGDEDE